MTPAPSTVTASVLFLDIVKYSLQPMSTQAELLASLQKAVQECADYKTADGAKELRKLPTGDGMALVFLGDPAAPVRCALQLAALLKQRRSIQLRMGINTGPVVLKPDINDKENVVGEGINIAQRVMERGDAGHILLSQSTVDHLNRDGSWTTELLDLGLCEVKHAPACPRHLHRLKNAPPNRGRNKAARTNRLAHPIPVTPPISPISQLLTPKIPQNP